MRLVSLEWGASRLPRYSLAIVLFATGVAKMTALHGSGKFLLPVELLVGVAAVEIVVAAAILLMQGRWAVWAGIALGLGFQMSTLYMVARGMDVRRCGCLGAVQGDAMVHSAIAFAVVVLGLLVDGDRDRSSGGLST